jgi:hypothetical protein
LQNDEPAPSISNGDFVVRLGPPKGGYQLAAQPVVERVPSVRPVQDNGGYPLRRGVGDALVVRLVHFGTPVPEGPGGPAGHTGLAGSGSRTSGVVATNGPSLGRLGKTENTGTTNLSVPTTPGVYFLLDGEHGVAYVGMASDIRRRLSEHTRTLRWTAVTGVAWELAATQAAAAAREADLLAGLQPPWNKVVDGFFSYVTIGTSGLELSRDGEYGCFPHLGRGSGTRPSGDCIDGYDALNRILKLSGPDTGLVRDFLSGSSDRLLRHPVDVDQPHVRTGLNKDRELAGRFFRAGPAALRRLRRVHEVRGRVSREQFAEWMRIGAKEAVRTTGTEVNHSGRIRT